MSHASLLGGILLALPTPQSPLPPPTLSAAQSVVIGEQVEFVLSGTVQLPPVEELLLLDLAILPAPVPFPPYGELFLAASPAFQIVPGDGSSTWTLGIPPDPQLVGLEVHAQALGLVYAGFFGEVLLSNPVTVEIDETPPPATRLAVVANRGDGSLNFLGVDLSGAATRHFGVEAPGGELRAVATSPDGRFVFSVDATSDAIRRFEIDAATGERSALGSTATGARPVDLEVDPTGRYVYAANSLGDSISQYRSNDLGDLIPLNPPTVSTGQTPTDLTLDPTGSWLFAVTAGSGLLSIHSIDDATGRLSLSSVFPLEGAVSRVLVGGEGERIHLLSGGAEAVSTWAFDTLVGQITAPIGSPVPVPPGTVDAALHPDGDALYLLDAAGSVLVQHAVDPASGVVDPSPVGFTPTAAGAAALRIDPRGERLYVCGIAENELWIHAPQTVTGVPDFVQRLRQRSLPLDVAMISGEAPTDIQSRVVLAGHAGSNEVRTFQLDAALGQLIDLGAGSATSGPGATALSLDPSTGSLASADSGASVSTFRFNVENANLAATGPVALASAPAGVVIEPSGRFGWSSEPALDRLRRFTYVAGVPTDAGSVALAPDSDPGPLAATPAGNWLFVGQRGDARISTFRIASDGELTQTGSVGAQGTPVALAVTPDGRHLIVVSSGPGRVTSYALDPQLGAPTPVTSLAIGNDPVGLAVTPTGQTVYVADGAGQNVRIFALDPESGALTSSATQGLPDMPAALAVDAAGLSLIVAIPSIDIFTLFTIGPDGSGLASGGFWPSGGDAPTTLAPSVELD